MEDPIVTLNHHNSHILCWPTKEAEQVLAHILRLQVSETKATSKTIIDNLNFKRNFKLKKNYKDGN